jgi:hypothetical protein
VAFCFCDLPILIFVAMLLGFQDLGVRFLASILLLLLSHEINQSTVVVILFFFFIFDLVSNYTDPDLVDLFLFL